MRILVLAWVALLLSCVNTAQNTTVPASVLPKNIAERISFRNNAFDIYKVYDHRNIRFFWKNEKGEHYKNFDTLNAQLCAKNDSLRFAVNGGMYNSKLYPQGLYIEGGKTLKKIDKDDGKGNFYMKPNGIFLINEAGAKVIETTKFDTHSPTLFATQSGPMLLIGGAIHPAFNEGSKNLNIRNAVGIADDGAVVFIISNERVNFYDFASLFKEQYGCKNALYLDGFVSKCHLPELQRNDKGGNFGVIIGVTQTFLSGK